MDTPPPAASPFPQQETGGARVWAVGEGARHAAVLLEPDVHVECFSGSDALLERLALGVLPEVVELPKGGTEPTSRGSG